MTSEELVKIACEALDEKKGLDIVSINVESMTVICDYFIICSGKNPPQVKALCDNVTEKFAKEGLNPKSREGYAEGRWIALDFGDVVIHIFNDETRLFYHLERLWANEKNMVKYIPSPKIEEVPVKSKNKGK